MVDHASAMLVAECVCMCYASVRSYCHTCIQSALEQVIGEQTAETRLYTWGHSGLHVPDSWGKFHVKQTNEQTNERMNERASERTNERTNIRVSECTIE